MKKNNQTACFNGNGDNVNICNGHNCVGNADIC